MFTLGERMFLLSIVVMMFAAGFYAQTCHASDSTVCSTIAGQTTCTTYKDANPYNQNEDK